MRAARIADKRHDEIKLGEGSAAGFVSVTIWVKNSTTMSAQTSMEKRFTARLCALINKDQTLQKIITEAQTEPPLTTKKVRLK